MNLSIIKEMHLSGDICFMSCMLSPALDLHVKVWWAKSKPITRINPSKRAAKLLCCVENVDARQTEKWSEFQKSKNTLKDIKQALVCITQNNPLCGLTSLLNYTVTLWPHYYSVWLRQPVTGSFVPVYCSIQTLGCSPLYTASTGPLHDKYPAVHNLTF